MAVESEKETRHEVSLLGHRQQLGQECEDALLVTTPYEKHWFYEYETWPSIDDFEIMKPLWIYSSWVGNKILFQIEPNDC